MFPISTPDCNFTFGAPAGQEADVLALHCRRHEQGFTSYWQPSPAEREVIAAGGHIIFTCRSNFHPVVSLTAGITPRTAPGRVVPEPQAINHLLCQLLFFQMGMESEPPDLAPLESLTLAEMVAAVAHLRANNQIRDEATGTTTLITVADDRLVAAAYALIHYRLRPQDIRQETVVFDGHQALVIVKAEHSES